MEGISDIRINGIDEMRPPMIRKEPYIDLVFKFNHKVPENWCNDFSNVAARTKIPVKIDPKEGVYIQTWVRKPEDVQGMLDKLKVVVKTTSDEYVARIKAEALANVKQSVSPDAVGEQGRLNDIVDALNYDDME